MRPEDFAYMALALQLAERGRYTTTPNPCVGCVLVREGQVIGTGSHWQAGAPHAEVLALRAAGGQAVGATAYVTLEPCSHQGRTPPCAEALIAAGVTRVVAAIQDPNPQVAGRGLARLQAAGVTTECGLLAEAAQALNRGFFSRMQRQRPWVRLKLAQSLDGRTALANGASQWITGAAARQDVQYGRAQACAIITGAGTVQADDPRLDVRLSPAELDLPTAMTVRQPLRVVLDSQGRLGTTHRIWQVPGPVVQVVTVPVQAAHQVQLPADAQGRVALPALLRWLALERHCNIVWVEAGPTLAGAFWQAGLVDELLLYTAPRILGDAARPLLRLPELTTLTQAIPLQVMEQRALGADWRLRALVLNE